jgi:hypothetical protein
MDGIGRSAKKKPRITGPFVQHRSWLDCYMVTQKGFEPPAHPAEYVAKFALFSRNSGES